MTPIVPFPPQNRMAVYNSERGHVESILQEGAKRARASASEVLTKVRHAVGLVTNTAADTAAHTTTLGQHPPGL